MPVHLSARFFALCCLIVMLHAAGGVAHAQWSVNPLYVARTYTPQHGVGVSAGRVLATDDAGGHLGVRAQFSYSAGSSARPFERQLHSGMVDVSLTGSVDFGHVRPELGIGLGAEKYGLRSGTAIRPDVTGLTGYGVLRAGMTLWPTARIAPFLGMQGRKLFRLYKTPYNPPVGDTVHGELLLGLRFDI